MCTGCGWVKGIDHGRGSWLPIFHSPWWHKDVPRLTEIYWWNGMKRNITDFVARCPNRQQVKAEHQRPGGLTPNIDILTWKQEDIKMEFGWG